MNTSSTNQPHITINTFKQSKTKKKSLPISINSNIAPGSFLFNNKVSKVATSYKNIGDQINTYEKLKQLNQKGKAQSNVLMINNFFSVNNLSSKNSQMSNNSILNKNNSNIMSSRINPSKNTSNILFSKNNLINNLTGYTTCTSNRNAKYKTISKDKYNDINNQNTQRNMKLKAVKQIRRQKSIVSLVPSSKGNKMISFKSNYHTKSIINGGDNQRLRNYNMSVILNNNHTNDKASPNNSQNIYVNVNHNINKAFNTIRSEGNSVRNKSERSTVTNCVITKVCKNRSVSLKHNNNTNNKKSFKKTIHTETIDVDNTNNTKTDRKYEKAFNILSVPSQSCKNKNISTINKNGNVLTTYGSFNTSNTIGNLNNNNNNITHIKTIKVETGSRKRRLSHGSISLTKETQLNQNEIVSHHRNNNSISINRLALNKFIIHNNNEKKQQQINNNNNIQHNINSNDNNNNNNDDIQTKQQIKINLNPLFQDIKVSSTNRPKQNIPLEKVQVNRKQKSQSKNNNNTQNKHSSQKQEQLFRNNIHDNMNNIIYDTNKLSLIDNTNANTNNTNIVYKNLFENENIIYDDPPLKDDPFDNLNDVVRRLNFKSINTAQANIFSIENNFKYKSYQSYFDIEFDKKVKSKHSLTTTNITSAHKALSTGNKSSERKSFHNVSMSTQDNSNKKYVSSPIHRISYCN